MKEKMKETKTALLTENDLASSKVNKMEFHLALLMALLMGHRLVQSMAPLL